MRLRTLYLLSVAVLTAVAVLASASSLRGQCSGACVYSLTEVVVQCHAPGCSEELHFLVPSGGGYGFDHASSYPVYCCTNGYCTYYFDGNKCAAPVKEGGVSTLPEQESTYVYVRGCDGGYWLTALAAGI